MHSRTLAILAFTVVATTALEAGTVAITPNQKLSNFVSATPTTSAPANPFPGSPDVTTACLSARCFSTYSDASLNTIPFALASDYSSAGAANIWASSNLAVDTTLVLNLGVGTGGVFNALSVYTLLTSIWAAPGYNGLTITFAGLNSSLAGVSESVNLLAGYDYRSYYNGEGINGGNDNCTVASASTSAATCTTSLGGSNGQNARKDTSAQYAAANVGSAITTTVYNNVWWQPSLTGGESYHIDGQRMDLGTMFAGGYLDSITFTAHNTVGLSGGTPNKILLEAVTIGTVPEPGTSMMLVSGLGALFVGLRRRKKN